MKLLYRRSIIFILFYLLGLFTFSQSVGINTNTPDSSAAFEVNSTGKGFLMPRMTQAQRESILQPANGLLVYQTDALAGFYYFNGQNWQGLVGSHFSGNNIFGDGSAGLYVNTIDSNWSSNPPGTNLQFASLTVNESTTLTVPSGTTIRVLGDVAVNGHIRVLPASVSGDNGVSNMGVSSAPAIGIYGGKGLSVLQSALIRKAANGVFGGGSGLRNTQNVGGEGGGFITIVAGGKIQVSGSGSIEANGNNTTNTSIGSPASAGGGGGAGGVVILLSGKGMQLAGSIKANGGNGAVGMSAGGGGGGGGIIHLILPVAPVIPGVIQTIGGNGGGSFGIFFGMLAGNGGGACGGNGGNGGQYLNANAGEAGRIITTIVPNPAIYFSY